MMPSPTTRRSAVELEPLRVQAGVESRVEDRVHQLGMVARAVRDRNVDFKHARVRRDGKARKLRRGRRRIPFERHRYPFGRGYILQHRKQLKKVLSGCQRRKKDAHRTVARLDAKRGPDRPARWPRRCAAQTSLALIVERAPRVWREAPQIFGWLWFG